MSIWSVVIRPLLVLVLVIYALFFLDQSIQGLSILSISKIQLLALLIFNWYLFFISSVFALYYLLSYIHFEGILFLLS